MPHRVSLCLHVSSDLIVPHHVLSCLMMFHRVSLFVMMSHQVLPCLIMSHYGSSCLIVCCPVSSCFIMSHRFSLCVIMSHQVSPCLSMYHHDPAYLIISRVVSIHHIPSIASDPILFLSLSSFHMLSHHSPQSSRFFNLVKKYCPLHSFRFFSTHPGPQDFHVQPRVVWPEQWGWNWSWA